MKKNNKRYLVFKDGHEEEILSCVRYEYIYVPQRAIYIETSSAWYIAVETLEFEPTPFADDNPFGKMNGVTRWYKDVRYPGRKQDKLNHVLIDDVVGVKIPGIYNSREKQ